MKRDFSISITVKSSAENAFNAIKSFKDWWSEEIVGSSDVLNKSFFYHYKDIHLCRVKLIEVEKNKKLVYLVEENEFNFVDDKTEWVNTKLIFDIEEQAGKTTIRFVHEGLVPEYECFEICKDAWTTYIKGSLKNLIEKGKGSPNPKEKDGLNAKLAKKWKLNSEF